MTPSISLRNVTKSFGRNRRGRRPLYRELVSAVRSESTGRTVTALDALDLELPGPGAVALVGPNGAGKSTLLRVIAGIYRRVQGEVRVDGRVVCFFGAQAGAAPSLSVLDNVHLQGAINGLTAKETRHNLDAILELAELEDQVDTRMEHLSFGTRQRLLFAVIIQTMKLGKADIYLFDEWLAGGDSRFAEKAEREAVAARGRGDLVLYASHDLARLRRTCDGAIFLRDGTIRETGPPDAVIDRYLEECGGRRA